MRIVLTLLFLIPLFAQGQGTTIKGTVYSGAYFGGINKVHVRNGIRSTKTDRNGDFSLQISYDEPLIISHVKFDNQEISSQKLRDLDTYDFYLTPTSTATSEVIEQNEAEQLFSQNFENVFDYTFDSDTLIVLSYMHEENMRDRQYINCVLTALKYGEIVQRLFIPNNIRFIKQHASGTIYLAGPERVVQLYRENDLYNYKLINGQNYDDNISPAYAINGDKLYYKNKVSVLPRIVHGMYEYSSKSLREIRTIDNPKYFAKTHDDYAMLNKPEYLLAKELSEETGLYAANFAPYIRSYYMLRDILPSYSPGFISEEQWLIFDHTNQWLFKHDLNGNPLDSIGIYHDDLIREDLVQIIQDPIVDKLYVQHNKSGVHYIREFDIETGATGRPYQINKVFPKRVKIFNGYVYYLYQSPIDNKTWELYREKLPFVPRT